MIAVTAPTSAPTLRRFGRVPELDGIRAIAVLMVVASHIGILRALPSGWKLSGGFLGVDVFFVLSGFLITTLLLQEQSLRGRTRFGAFYRRRALRLLPVVVTFLAAHVVFSQLVLDVPGELERRGVAAAVFFSTNWLAVYERVPVAFGHLWSLAVEEQFYLVWPFVTMAFSIRARFRTVLIVLVSLVVLVAIQRFVLWDGGNNIARALLGTDAHADGLLVGALLSHCWIRGKTPRRGLATWATAGCVFVVVCSAVVDANSAFLYRGGFTLIGLATAAVLLGILDGNWPGSRVLGLAPLRAIGRVSYGAYVWHPLVFWWVAYEMRNAARATRFIAALTITAAVIAISWFLIERPFLRWKDRLERMDTLR